MMALAKRISNNRITNFEEAFELEGRVIKWELQKESPLRLIVR